MLKISLPNPNSQIRTTIIVCQLGIIVFLSIMAILENQLLLDAEAFIYPSCILFIILILWSFLSWIILTKSIFSPYILFVISTSIFNGGHIFLEVLNLNPVGILSNQFSPDTILQTIFLVTLSISSLQLGALLSTATASPISSVAANSTLEESASINPSMNQDIRKIGWILLVISLPPTILLLRNAIGAVAVSGYSGLYESTEAEGGATRVLSGFIIPSAIFLLAGSQHKPLFRRLSILLVFLYSIIYNFLGQRTQGILPLIGLAWIWHQIIRPLPKKIFLPLTFFAAFIVSPLIAEIRSSTGAEKFSFSSLVEKFTLLENPITKSLFEFGGTMQTIAYTIELVPNTKDFNLGADYLFAILTLVPNIGFWTVHPSVARGLPSAWLSLEVTPRQVLQGYYLGYSFIAEAYLNFGWFGVPIFMSIFGFCFGKLLLWATRLKEPAKMAVVASLLPSLLFFCRQESTQIVRPFVLYCLTPYLGVLILHRLRKKKMQ